MIIFFKSDGTIVDDAKEATGFEKLEYGEGGELISVVRGSLA